jgi:hydrogenase/urease accessory protein HupE
MTQEGMILFSALGNLTLDLLIVALSIFVWLTASSRSIRSFQFQICLFLAIWIVGEMVDLLQEQNVLLLPSNETGTQVHVVAMGVFSAMLWIRYYMSKRKGKTMVDSLQEG